MAKKYLLHRITDEDAQYIAEDTHTSYNEVKDGNCYILINSDNGKIYREEGKLLIYKASGIRMVETVDDKQQRFVEAIEACAYFRGYANTHEIRFKTPKIPELLYKLEDHEIEIQESCNQSKIVSSTNTILNQEVVSYMNEAFEGYALLNRLQRNLPTLALFVNEAITGRNSGFAYISEEPEEEEELPFG